MAHLTARFLDIVTMGFAPNAARRDSICPPTHIRRRAVCLYAATLAWILRR
jgi:hypothetical protein